MTINITKKPLVTHTDLSIQREQLVLLYDSITVSALATLVNATMLAIVEWSFVGHQSIIVWYIIINFVTAMRWMTARAFKNSSKDLNEVLLWKRRFNLGALSAAIVWGLGMIFLFPEESLVHQSFLAFIMAGMCAGAVTSLSFMLFPVRIFLLISLVPLITQLLLGDSNIMIAMGIMILLFLIMVWISSKRIYLSTLQNIALRFDSIKQEDALELSEIKYQLIFDSAPVGIIQYDNKGYINSINRAFEEIIGQPQSKFLGRSLLKDVNATDIIKAVRQSLSGETGQITTIARHLAGNRDTPIRAYFRGQFSKNSNLMGGVGIIEDISEDYRVQKLKDEFISTISHELRTPLTSIKGSLGLLNSHYEMDSAQLEALLQIANRNSDRLSNLIDDILDISKLESDQVLLDLEHVDAADFLIRAKEINDPYGKEYQVNFIIKPCNEKLTIEVDTKKMMQVFSNLLSNAAKFSPPNSTVEISVYGKGDRVIFEVADQGCGIPEAFYPHVFERFMQADSSDTRNSDGTGLGLNISKAIVEKHQGKITFQSKLNEGTTFYVDLPSSKPLPT